MKNALQIRLRYLSTTKTGSGIAYQEAYILQSIKSVKLAISNSKNHRSFVFSRPARQKILSKMVTKISSHGPLIFDKSSMEFLRARKL